MAKFLGFLAIIASILASFTWLAYAANEIKSSDVEVDKDIDASLETEAKKFKEIETIVVMRVAKEGSKVIADYSRDNKDAKPEDLANFFTRCPGVAKIGEQVLELKCEGDKVAGGTKIVGRKGTYMAFASFSSGGKVEKSVKALRGIICAKYQLDNC